MLHINKVVQGLSLVIAAEAVLVIVGWIFGVDSLTRIMSSGINMSFPTAVMFLLSSVGLFVIHRISVQGDMLPNLFVLTGVTLLIFLITISVITGAILNVRTGMENLFVGEQDLEVINQSVAGMPAIPTLLGFFIFGQAIIFSLVRGNNRKKVVGFFSYPIFLIGFLAIIGYIAGIPLLYYRFNNNSLPIALNTAILFVLLAGGMFIISKLPNQDEV